MKQLFGRKSSKADQITNVMTAFLYLVENQKKYFITGRSWLIERLVGSCFLLIIAFVLNLIEMWS